MLVRNLFAVFFLFCAGLANGTMDSLQFHFSKSPYANEVVYDKQFWNPDLSWRNKYKDGDVAKGDKFLLSSTAFVFVTDAWHLFKFMMLKFFILAAVVCIPFTRRLDYTLQATWILNGALFIAFHIAFQSGFKLAYF